MNFFTNKNLGYSIAFLAVIIIGLTVQNFRLTRQVNGFVKNQELLARNQKSLLDRTIDLEKHTVNALSMSSELLLEITKVIEQHGQSIKKLENKK